MRTLELKDICGYLPYGLKVYHNQCIGTDTLFEVWYHPIKDDERVVCGINSRLKLDEITPILHPMSDLTKEITHKGQTFVPIVKLADIALPGRDWRISNAGTYAECGGIWDGYELSYTEGDFLLEERGHDGESYGGTKNWTVQIKNVVSIFDKLSEWKFDYRGLIDEGLAIDVNTLP